MDELSGRQATRDVRAVLAAKGVDMPTGAIHSRAMRDRLVSRQEDGTKVVIWDDPAVRTRISPVGAADKDVIHEALWELPGVRHSGYRPEDGGMISVFRDA